MSLASTSLSFAESFIVPAAFDQIENLAHRILCGKI
jgi:hypothetical protein